MKTIAAGSLTGEMSSQLLPHPRVDKLFCSESIHLIIVRVFAIMHWQLCAANHSIITLETCVCQKQLKGTDCKLSDLETRKSTKIEMKLLSAIYMQSHL